MSIRTPRRRISPRARRRYRAIRNFFKRTLSSLTSLSGNKINSSTTENVTNLNRSDIMGHQLHAVPQNYRGLACGGNVYRRHTDDFTPREGNSALIPNQRRRRFSAQDFVPKQETKVLYKTPQNLCRNSHEFGLRFYDDHSDMEQHSLDRMNYAHFSSSHDIPNQKPKKDKQKPFENLNRRPRLRKRGAPTLIENSVSGFDSYESLTTPFQTTPGHTYRDPVPQNSACYSRQQEYIRDAEPDVVRTKRRRAKRYKSKSPHVSKERRKKKKNEPPAQEEQQFIADIINRQYKNFSVFGRRASDISQISTPVCRDQRYSARDIVIPDSEVSSFSPRPVGGRRPCPADVRDMRSLCDTRIHSAPWPARQRRHRHQNYNDSNLYDVVPVKEKTSPKSRRKFMEDNLIMNEVPPSPRTHRPRLNLETQNFSAYEDYEQHEIQMPRTRSPNRRPEYEYVQAFRHDVSTEETPRIVYEMNPKCVMRSNNTTRLHDDMGTAMSSQQNLTSQNNTTNDTLNNSKTHDTDNVDKTDQALCEIKNILQNFLQELKKDSSTSQCDRVSGSDKNSGKQLDGTRRGSDNETSNVKNSAGSSFNCGMAQGCTPAMPPQFMPGYGNPCCFPQVIPMYGAQGVPYLVASPSCVCANVACGHNHIRHPTDIRDIQCPTCSKVNCTESEPSKSNCDTDLLIREIYNFVKRNPSMCKESRNVQDQPGDGRSPRRKPSIGKSMHALHQDANVGTPPLRCYSKSCEAIVSRQLFDTYYATYPSYSNSLLEERPSREAVADYQMPRESNEYTFKDKRSPTNVYKQQSQDSKFTSALRLLRMHKKNRREHVHEVCHSEQSIEVDVVPKRNSFRQELTAYTMHGQEFVRPPPLRHDPRYPPTYDYDYSPCDPPVPDMPYASSRPVSERYQQHYDCMPTEEPDMYDNSYEQYQAHSSHAMQPPLCFKEVEVRSIGIQSEKKTSFRLFPQKKESKDVPESPPPRLVSILRDKRMEETPDTKPEKPRKLFNFKPPIATSKSDPMASLSERIQKDLTKNDKTMTNAMLRKLFYKRNPFSPQNRFVRTIMEKDTPVFKWRPRMFL